MTYIIVYHLSKRKFLSIRYRLNIAPKHPYLTRLQSKLMADQESSSQDNRSELAEIKEQMNQMMKIILDLQKARDTEADTSAKGTKQPQHSQQSTQKGDPKIITGNNRRKDVIIMYEDKTDNQGGQQSHYEESDDENEDPTHGRTTNYQEEAKTSKGTSESSPSQDKAELELIKERLRAIDGTNFPDVKNLFEMCLVPDVVLPPKFKTPEFEKYDGTSCPKIHLHMYTRKMTAYHGNDQIKNDRGSHELVHSSQEGSDQNLHRLIQCLHEAIQI
ncbi:unnamed protein product [Lupinus luteus]|uniref:Uncharacterized protein n=1 Tax=Lupinus luteus TaxID=3873 RepID=A0AAV1YA50_LUPLU